MVISLITYVLELYDESKWLNWVGMIVLVAGIVMGIKSYRDKENGGYISYGGALGYGTLIALFAAIITSFVNYIYLGYVDDGFITHQLMVQEDEMYNSGMPEEQIEMAIDMTKKFMKPGMIAISGILMTTFIGFIVSLIAGAFLKKESENFEDAA